MDGKRNIRRRVAANVLLTARYDFPPCAVIHAGTLVWVARRRIPHCNHLHFYADCSAACCLGRIFPGYHAEWQCRSAHLPLPAAKRSIISWRAYCFEKENLIDKRDGYDSNQGSQCTEYPGCVRIDNKSRQR